MKSWAERETELAIQHEINGCHGDEHEASYGIGIYKSALKAYKCLMDDGHTGTSFDFTKNILNRLLTGQVLTPIENTPDVWGKFETFSGNRKMCVCKRMPSLFKNIDANGNISFNDVNRVKCYEIGHDASFYNGFISNLINEVFPITFPYYPIGQFEVYSESFLTDEKNGDYDTQGIFYCITPEGKRVDINRYFKEGEKSEKSFIEITEEEYQERKARRIDHGNDT